MITLLDLLVVYRPIFKFNQMREMGKRGRGEKKEREEVKKRGERRRDREKLGR